MGWRLSSYPEATLALLESLEHEILVEIGDETIDHHYESIRRNFKQDHPNLSRLPEHPAAIDGQTEDVCEVEADCRRMSVELQHDDAEQEQLAALWEDEPLVKVWANGNHGMGDVGQGDRHHQSSRGASDG